MIGVWISTLGKQKPAEKEAQMMEMKTIAVSNESASSAT